MIKAQQERVHQNLSQSLMQIREKQLETHQFLSQVKKTYRKLSQQMGLMGILLWLWCLPGWPFWQVSLPAGLESCLLLSLGLSFAAPRIAVILNPGLADWHESLRVQLSGLVSDLRTHPEQDDCLSHSGYQPLFYLLMVTMLALALTWGLQSNLKQLADSSLWVIGILLYLGVGGILIARLTELSFRQYHLGRSVQLVNEMPQSIRLELEAAHLAHAYEFKASAEELKQSQQCFRSYSLRAWVLKGIGFLLALPLGYIGSLSLAHLSGFGYSYFLGIRMNPLFLVVFVVAVCLTEIAISQMFIQMSLKQYSLQQFMQGWHLQDRQQSRPYRFRALEQIAQEEKNVYLYGCLGGSLLLIDMGINAYYFTTQTSIPILMVVLVIILQPLGVISLAKYIANQVFSQQLAYMMHSQHSEQASAAYSDLDSVTKPIIHFQSIRKV